MFNSLIKTGEGALKIAGQEGDGQHKKHISRVSATAFSTERVSPSLATYCSTSFQSEHEK